MIEWLAALLCATGAIVALEARQLMRGLLGLTTFFLGVAILFGVYGAWFLAAGQLILFVGGVATLLVLAFNVAPPPAAHPPVRGTWLVAFAVAALFALALPLADTGTRVAASELARAFFTMYGGALHVALLLLFSAVLGAYYLLEDDA